MPKDGQSPRVESNDDNDTRAMFGRFPDARGGLVHQSTTGDGTALSAELFGKTILESTGGKAVERVGSRPEASVVTGASLAPDVVRGGAIINPRVSSPIEPTFPASARATRDSSEPAKQRQNSNEEPPHAERSGGSELKVDPDADCWGSDVFVPKDEGLVDRPQTSVTQPRDGDDMGDACGSEDREDSNASSDADSSEDEHFNSSVSTFPCQGVSCQ